MREQRIIEVAVNVESEAVRGKEPDKFSDVKTILALRRWHTKEVEATQ